MSLQVWLRKKKLRNPKHKEKLANHVWLLTKQGYKQIEIAKYVNRTAQTIYKIQNDLVQQGRLERDENGQLKIYRPKVDPTVFKNIQKDDFRKMPTITKWIEKKSQSNKGQGIKKLESYIGKVLVTCNTLQMHPDKIIYSYDERGEPTHLEALSNFMMQFSTAMKQGTVQYRNKKAVRTRMNGAKTGIVEYVRAWASLLESHGKPIPSKYGGKDHILSRNNPITTGSYSGIQLSDEEFEFGLSFTKAYGDKLQFLYAMQHEMITRTDAIFRWTVNYEIKEIEIEGVQCKYAEVRNFFEKKTNSHWTKLIIEPKALALLEKMPKGKTVFEAKRIAEMKAKYNAMLRRFYIRIGKLPDDTVGFEHGTEQWYLQHDPSYVLRHSGAHNWLRRCGYRYDLVSKLGWETVDTLAKYYARQSFDYLFRQNECYFCRPPKNTETANQYFCSLAHVLAYKNRKETPT